jgi:hypothetical protein
LCYYFGHSNIVYFAVPGPVIGLDLIPGSQSITVVWNKPSSNGDCVKNYIIEWVNTVSGNEQPSSATSEVGFFIIERLDACVDYEVSVKAVNADGVGDNTETRTTTTKTAGNCHTHIILLCL